MKKTRSSLFQTIALALVLGWAQRLVAQDPPASQSASVDISPGAAEVVRLAESGVGDDVVLAFIQNSTSTFNLSADQILYLKDLGISSPVITAMLGHDGAGRNPNPIPQEAPSAPPPSGPVEAPLTPPATYVATPPAEVNYFYNDLSPYGTWVQLDGVGWCWQPRTVVVNRQWRPYCDGGHWLDSDAGWYWQSDYSWGWAAFHYGRWHLHERCGWVWSPDTVWGPAWVIWRSGGDHCGWAPLPPHAVFDVRSGWRFNGLRVSAEFDFGLRADHFTFVSLNHFADRDLGHRRLEATEVRNVYNRTTIINNYTVRNNTIVNRGIPVEHVAAATHTEIRKVAIRDLPASSGTNPRLASSDKVVYRPQLKAPARTAPVVAQKVDEQHPVIHHAPVASLRADRETRPGYNSSAPVTAPLTPRRSSQPDVSRTSPRPNGEKSSAYPQNPSVPRNYQGEPAPRSRDAQPAPQTREPQPTRRSPDAQPSPRSRDSQATSRSQASQPESRSYQPVAAAPYSQPQTRPSEDLRQPARSPAPNRADAGASAQRYSGQREPAQNPHVYYPKTYQGAESHPAPPPQRQAPPSTSPAASDSRSKRSD